MYIATIYLRGGIHTQVAMLNVSMTFGGRGGRVVEIDADFSDFNVKELYPM